VLSENHFDPAVAEQFGKLRGHPQSSSRSPTQPPSVSNVANPRWKRRGHVAGSTPISSRTAGIRAFSCASSSLNRASAGVMASLFALKPDERPRGDELSEFLGTVREHQSRGVVGRVIEHPREPARPDRPTSRNWPRWARLRSSGCCARYNQKRQRVLTRALTARAGAGRDEPGFRVRPQRSPDTCRSCPGTRRTTRGRRRATPPAEAALGGAPSAIP